VDLWVRGTCTIRPGVPGLSENIRVRSILGRFLEHSRLFWFANDGSASVGIGSADLMHRNLDRRVEVLVSITNPAHISEIGELFDIAFDKGTATWHLLPDGSWVPHTTDEDGNPLLDMQEYLINTKSRRRVAMK
jgi:polyphosphate kinase